MSNNSSVPGGWGGGSGASDWTENTMCPPSVGGATFLIVAYSTVIAIGLLGNAGLVFIIARQQELRNVTNILIANLSCSDILMCLVCLPVTVIYTLMDHWVLGEALCKVKRTHTHMHAHTHTHTHLPAGTPTDSHTHAHIHTCMLTQTHHLHSHLQAHIDLHRHAHICRHNHFLTHKHTTVLL